MTVQKMSLRISDGEHPRPVRSRETSPRRTYAVWRPAERNLPLENRRDADFEPPGGGCSPPLNSTSMGCH